MCLCACSTHALFTQSRLVTYDQNQRAVPLEWSKTGLSFRWTTIASSNSCLNHFIHCTIVGIRADRVAAQGTLRLTVTSKLRGLCPNCLVKMIRAKERQRHSCCPPLLSSEQHWLHATITSSTKTRKKFIEVFRIHLAIGKGYIVNPVLVFRDICETLVQMKGLLQRRRSILEVIAHIMSAHVSNLTTSNMQTSSLCLNLFVIISDLLLLLCNNFWNRTLQHYPTSLPCLVQTGNIWTHVLFLKLRDKTALHSCAKNKWEIIDVLSRCYKLKRSTTTLHYSNGKKKKKKTVSAQGILLLWL